MTTIKNLTEGKEKKLKSLSGFLSDNNIDNYNRRVVGGGRKKIQKNQQNKSKHKNNECFS